MQNIVINMCEKFHDDRWRNDEASGNWKSYITKNPKKKNVRSAYGHVSESEKRWTVSMKMTVIESIYVQKKIKIKVRPISDSWCILVSRSIVIITIDVSDLVNISKSSKRRVTFAAGFVYNI